MKKNISITGLAIMLMLLTITGVDSFAFVGSNKDKKSQQDYITIRGKVVDMETGVPLVFAGVAVKESNVATVTNLDGEFLLKVPQSEKISIEFSFLGYKNKVLSISELRTNGQKNIIALETAAIPIKEVVVKPMDAEEIVSEAINHFKSNYPTVPNELTGFYRETIKKNRSYVSIGEAVVQIFKAPYNNDLRFDAVRIFKGRQNTNTDKMDTVLFRLQGGPVTSLELDLVKNPESILTQESIEQFDLTLSSIVAIDDRTNYVINFVQKPGVETPLFTGRFFIDMETYAIAQVEFGVNLSDKDAAASMFIRKKPFGMSVTPELTSYLIRYKENNGKWYFTYSRAEVKFKVDWKKKLFNTNYTTMSEIAVTDRTEEDVLKFTSKEKMKPNDFFTEEVKAFADPEFWGDYNIIEPDQSIETAIKRLNRKLKFSNN
jgi:hypothetical protein